MLSLEWWHSVFKQIKPVNLLFLHLNGVKRNSRQVVSLEVYPKIWQRILWIQSVMTTLYSVVLCTTQHQYLLAANSVLNVALLIRKPRSPQGGLDWFRKSISTVDGCVWTDLYLFWSSLLCVALLLFGDKYCFFHSYLLRLVHTGSRFKCKCDQLHLSSTIPKYLTFAQKYKWKQIISSKPKIILCTLLKSNLRQSLFRMALVTSFVFAIRGLECLEKCPPVHFSVIVILTTN